MRRFLIIACIAGAIALPANATHTWGWADIIVAPRVDVPGDPDMLARCDYLARGADSRIWLGYMLEVPPEVADGTRTFTLADGFMGGATPDANPPDITFFSDLGACDPNVPPTVLARHFGPADKHGIVPAGARFALVTIAGDSTSTFFLETDYVIPHGCRQPC